MNKQIREYLKDVTLNQATTLAVIKKSEIEFGITIPSDFKTFLKEHNGCEGSVGENAYLVLWSIEDIVELNEAYEVNEFAPGLLLIGSNGGEQAYAYDMRFDAKPIVSVPFIGMELGEILPCANTFEEFLEYLYNY